MFRRPDFNAEIAGDLIDKPLLPGLGAAPDGFTDFDFQLEHRGSDGRRGSSFAHAVLDLAALSLSARTVLALRS